MKFNSLIPELSVSNIEATRHFYLDVLQFTLEYERPEELFLFVSCEGNQLMLEQENGHWSTGPLEHPYGRGINFEMTVSDVGGLYQRVLDAGIVPFRELSVSRYETGTEVLTQKQFLVQDPDGYLLRFTD